MVPVPAMVKVQAIVREEALDRIIERLLLIGIRGLTMTPVRGASRGDAHTAVFRGGSYPVHFISKVLIEWYGDTNQADAVVRAIVRAGATGSPGDGKIIVEPVEEAVRIRTGERGLEAL
jgi:nitrogen regulatory protein P-II 1